MRTPLPFISDTLPDIIILQNKCKKNSNHPQHKHLLEPFKMEVSGSYLFSVLEKQPKRVLGVLWLVPTFLHLLPQHQRKKSSFPFNSVHQLFHFFKRRHVDKSSRCENFLKKLKNAFIIRSINVMRLHGNSTYHLLKNKKFQSPQVFREPLVHSFSPGIQ